MLRVDTIPPIFKPAFHLFGYGGAVSMQAMFSFMRATCTFEHDGSNANSSSSCHGPRIECLWHENLPAYMAHYLPPPSGRPRHVWLNHPAWRMRPIHIWLEWNGVEKLILGSTGHGGQEALDDLIKQLRNKKYSTAVAVDGPSGPVREIKRGALDLSLMTGLPLVGIAFQYDRSIRAPGWDGKHYPIPSTIVRIKEGRPMRVTEKNYEECRELLHHDLG